MDILNKKYLYLTLAESVFAFTKCLFFLYMNRSGCDRRQSGLWDWEKQHLPGVCSSLPAGYNHMASPTGRPQGRGETNSRSNHIRIIRKTLKIRIIKYVCDRRKKGKVLMGGMKLLRNGGLITACKKGISVWFWHVADTFDRRLTYGSNQAVLWHTKVHNCSVFWINRDILPTSAVCLWQIKCCLMSTGNCSFNTKL